jgi:hypothetical protein
MAKVGPGEGFRIKRQTLVAGIAHRFVWNMGMIIMTSPGLLPLKPVLHMVN